MRVQNPPEQHGKFPPSEQKQNFGLALRITRLILCQWNVELGRWHVLASAAHTPKLGLYIEFVEPGIWHVLVFEAHTLILGLYIEA